MEMRQVALRNPFRHQEKGKLADLTRFHGQGWLNLEENPTAADIFQYPLTVLAIARFGLRHDKPDGQLEVKSRMTSFVHGNSSHPQSGDFGLLSAQLKNLESLPSTRPTPREAIMLSRYEGISA
jgi:hypothetical protein